MKAIDVIQGLEAASSRVAKEKLVFDAYTANCTEFFEAMLLAGDPFCFFGLKRVGEILEDDGSPGSLSFAEFQALCYKLADMNAETAKKSIHAAAERCHAPTWNLLYRRILLKSMQDTVTMVDTVLKKLGEPAAKWRPPVFAAQAAATMRRGTKITGSWLIDVKRPGTRLLAVLDRCVRFHTFDGAPYEGDITFRNTLSALAAWLPGAIVLDGVLDNDGTFYIFDLIPLADFKRRLCSKTQRERRSMLTRLQQAGGFSASRTIRVLPQLDLNFDESDATDRLEELARWATDHGATSLVWKKPEAPYIGKKNNGWQVRMIESVTKA